MPSFLPITIHQSQCPTSLAAQLRDSFRRGEINPKFHYESPRQVRKWLSLHDTYSPARREVDFHSVYEPAFEAARGRLGRDSVHLIGLGCGGGQKEAALLGRLVTGRPHLVFSAADTSSGMVVSTLQAAWNHIEPVHCSGLVCDLAEAGDLGAFFDPITPAGARRLVTFFGLIPNFEPRPVHSLWQRILHAGDLLLCSANLAPSANYRSGVEQVLPQYDNTHTREWLEILLADVGIERDAGGITFHIEEAPVGSGLLRITALFEFRRSTRAVVEGETLEFDRGRHLRLFFSYRHTIRTLEQLCAVASLRLLGSWISRSGEEGVFLLGR